MITQCQILIQGIILNVVAKQRIVAEKLPEETGKNQSCKKSIKGIFLGIFKKKLKI